MQRGVRDMALYLDDTAPLKVVQDPRHAAEHRAMHGARTDDVHTAVQRAGASRARDAAQRVGMLSAGERWRSPH